MYECKCGGRICKACGYNTDMCDVVFTLKIYQVIIKIPNVLN